MSIHEMIKQEIARMLDGGAFNDSFWQSLYNPSRDEMYRLQRERDGEIYLLTAEANQLAAVAPFGGIPAQRAARKAGERVRKFKGVLRARKVRRAPDEINLAWQASVQWIADARDAAVYLARMNRGLENAVSVREIELPKPYVAPVEKAVVRKKVKPRVKPRTH